MHNGDEPSQLPDGARSGFDRRRLLKSAAVGGAVAAGVWAKPSVEDLSLGGYPAMASPGCVAPVLNGTNPALWTENDTFIGWQADSGDLGPFGFPAPNPAVPASYVAAGFATARTPLYLVEQDPTAGTYTYAQTVATYTSSAFTLTAASTFTFRFNIRWRTTGNHSATQQVSAEWARAVGGPWTSAYTLQTALGGGGFTDVPNQSFSLAITSANAGTYFFRYRFSFNGTVTTSPSSRANDLAVTLPTSTCA